MRNVVEIAARQFLVHIVNTGFPDKTWCGRFHDGAMARASGAATCMECIVADAANRAWAARVRAKLSR